MRPAQGPDNPGLAAEFERLVVPPTSAGSLNLRSSPGSNSVMALASSWATATPGSPVPATPPASVDSCGAAFGKNASSGFWRVMKPIIIAANFFRSSSASSYWSSSHSRTSALAIHGTPRNWPGRSDRDRCMTSAAGTP